MVCVTGHWSDCHARVSWCHCYLFNCILTLGLSWSPISFETFVNLVHSCHIMMFAMQYDVTTYIVPHKIKTET